MIYTAEYTTFPAEANSADEQKPTLQTLQVNTEELESDVSIFGVEAEAVRRMQELQMNDKKNIYTFGRVRT